MNLETPTSIKSSKKCSRDSLEAELELNIVYRYILKTYRELYGKKRHNAMALWERA